MAPSVIYLIGIYPGVATITFTYIYFCFPPHVYAPDNMYLSLHCIAKGFILFCIDNMLYFIYTASTLLYNTKPN